MTDEEIFDEWKEWKSLWHESGAWRKSSLNDFIRFCVVAAEKAEKSFPQVSRNFS